MRSKLRKYLETLQRLPSPLFVNLIERITTRKLRTYSSYGEDALIVGLLSRYSLEFGKTLTLSYIDIGAWRPISASNTYIFYKQGQSGTVVEPNPHFRRLWRSTRPRDNYLEVGCSSSERENLLIFHDSASSNTFDLDFAKEITDKQPFMIQKSLKVYCLPLSTIISKHVAFSTLPFMLDIDVEGKDLEVIKTHSFSDGLRPILILIEDTCSQFNSLSQSEINIYLLSHDYKLVGRAALTSIYVDARHELSSCVSSII